MPQLARLARGLGQFAATLLLAGFLGATLVRLSPGYGSDELDLDARMSDATRNQLRQNDPASVLAFYPGYLKRVWNGDFGQSKTYGVPVRELMEQRLPRSARTIGGGLALGWAIAFPSAMLAAGLAAMRTPLTAMNSAMLCIPSGLLAILCFLSGVPVHGVVAAAVFPRIFFYLRNLLSEASHRPHVLAAAARGIRRWNIVWNHIAKPVLPEMAALAGASVTIAIGAAIPAEVFCDSAGIGRLAWKSALARDVVLLVTVTLGITVVTLIANGLGAAMSSRQRSWRA